MKSLFSLLAISLLTITYILSQSTQEAQTFIDFVGSGDIQKSLSSGDEISANTGLGAILERTFPNSKFFQNFEIEGLINIASTSDTIIAEFNESGKISNRRRFGTYLVNPISGKQGVSINSNIYLKRDYIVTKNQVLQFFINSISGLNLRMTASNNVFMLHDSSANLGALALRIGLFHEFLSPENRLSKDGRVKYSIRIGASFTKRSMFGDITTLSRDTFRKTLLNNAQKRFNGWEWFFGFRLNNLIAEFQAPVLDIREIPGDYSIEGLHNTQFLFTLRFVGGFSLKLKE